MLSQQKCSPDPTAERPVSVVLVPQPRYGELVLILEDAPAREPHCQYWFLSGSRTQGQEAQGLVSAYHHQAVEPSRT